MGHQRYADVRATATAILEQECERRAQSVEVRSIDDRPGEALGADESGPAENGEMRRHGVVRHLEAARDHARWKPFGFGGDQHTEDVEALPSG